MTALLACLRDLAATLEAETAALAAMDITGATALLERKSAQLATLAAAAPVAGDAPTHAAWQHVATLAESNRQALLRAIRVQKQVIDMVANAARHGARTGGYGAAGQPRRRTPLGLATTAQL